MPNLLTALLDWIYPPACIACRSLISLHDKQPRDMLMCAKCQTLFEPIGRQQNTDGVTTPLQNADENISIDTKIVSIGICNTCGIPTENPVERCVSCFGKTFHFTTNRAGFTYEDLMRDLLHELKFRQKKQIATSLGKLWALHMSTIPQDSILVPLSLHPKKQRERGFNQAEVLAQQLSQKFNIPCVNALVRTLDTPPQSGLHPRQRAENVAGAFAVNSSKFKAGRNYVIVDDIYTTGASLNECAKVLTDAGAKSVNCLTLSIVEKKR